jgi:hypothetical protein
LRFQILRGWEEKAECKGNQGKKTDLVEKWTLALNLTFSPGEKEQQTRRMVGVDLVWSAATCRRFQRRDMSRRSKARTCPRTPNHGASCSRWGWWSRFQRLKAAALVSEKRNCNVGDSTWPSQNTMLALLLKNPFLFYPVSKQSDSVIVGS